MIKHLQDNDETLFSFLLPVSVVDEDYILTDIVSSIQDGVSAGAHPLTTGKCDSCCFPARRPPPRRRLHNAVKI